jgi:iron complex outermembrane receptor protein
VNIIWGALRAGFGATAAVAVVAYTSAASAQTRSFDIPAQAAATGVQAFAAQADVQVAIADDAAQGRRTNAVKGAFPVERGLQILLEDTGLVAQQAGPGVYRGKRD